MLAKCKDPGTLSRGSEEFHFKLDVHFLPVPVFFVLVCWLLHCCLLK